MKPNNKRIKSISTATLLLGAALTLVSHTFAQQTAPQTDVIPVDNIPIPMKYVSPSIQPFRISTRVPVPPADAQARRHYATAQVLRLQGIALFVRGRTQDAIGVLNQARNLWPDSAEVYHWLAESYTTNGQPDQAISNYRLLFYGWPSQGPRNSAVSNSSIRPSDKPSDYNGMQPEEVDPRLWMQFSLLLQQENYRREALAAYDKGREYLAIHPMINSALALPSTENIGDSPNELEAATHTGLAIAEISKLATEDAANELEDAINLQPTFAAAYFYRGEMLKDKAGRSTDALAAYAKAAQYGGPQMQPFLNKSFQSVTPEFKAALKKAGLMAK